jgi:hypothetical protein
MLCLQGFKIGLCPALDGDRVDDLLIVEGWMVELNVGGRRYFVEFIIVH